MAAQVGLAKILSREITQVSMQSTFDWAAPEVICKCRVGFHFVHHPRIFSRIWQLKIFKSEELRFWDAVKLTLTTNSHVKYLQVLAGQECNEKADIWSVVRFTLNHYLSSPVLALIWHLLGWKMARPVTVYSSNDRPRYARIMFISMLLIATLGSFWYENKSLSKSCCCSLLLIASSACCNRHANKL